MLAVVMGDVVLDLVALTPQQLHRGSDTQAEIYPRPGGSPANTARWLARLGQPVRFAGRVGADAIGASLIEGLRSEGVGPRVAVDPEAPTGIILSLVEPGGERSMIISPGANRRMVPADLPPDLVAGAGLLHLTGYSFFFEGTRDAALAGLALARKGSIPVSVDAASTAPLREYGPERFLADVAGAHYFFCNIEEGAVLTGQQNPAAVLDALAARFPVVGLKLGPQGSLCARGTERVEQPAASVQAVDSTGAGDSWDAGLLAGLLAGTDLAAAARLGALTAAWVVARPGAVPAGWTAEDRQAIWAQATT